jgi:hypothetical protein
VAFRLQVVVDRREVDKWTTRTPQQINDALWEAAPEIGQLHVKTVKPYPPELPNQRYIRTWRMLHGWWWEREHTGKGEVVINVTNKMRYTKWVKDARYQANIHVGRHITVQQVSRQLERRSQGIWQRYLRNKVKT